MELMLGLIEGPLVGYLMVACGLVAIIALNLVAPVLIIIDDHKINDHRSLNVLYGAISFLIPLLVPFYALINWKQVSKTFYIGISCLVLAAGIFIVRAFLSIFFATGAPIG